MAPCRKPCMYFPSLSIPATNVVLCRGGRAASWATSSALFRTSWCVEQSRGCSRPYASHARAHARSSSRAPLYFLRAARVTLSVRQLRSQHPETLRPEGNAKMEQLRPRLVFASSRVALSLRPSGFYSRARVSVVFFLTPH